MDNLKILITGGAGFIGSCFTRLMLKKYPKYNITVFDALTYASNPETINEFKKYPNFSFIKGDIRDIASVDKAVSGMDAVVHFAAESHVDRSILDPGIFVDTNVRGTMNMLEAAKNHNIKRFIHISTDEVYGSVKKGKSVETDMLEPTSPYAASKTASDLIALAYFKTFNLPVIVTRSSNNFGPYQHPEKFIPLFITNAIEGKDLPLYGDGKQVRNWIYVEDNCAALETVFRKGKPGEVYNIGGNVEEPNILVAKTIIKQLKKPASIMKFVKDRLAHDRRYALSSAKIKKLGWTPKHTFTEALKLTINWYAENKNWWSALKGKAFKDYFKKAYK